MATKLEELTAQYAGERMRWDETILGSVTLPPAPGADPFLESFPTTIKGPADENELQYGVSYRFYGNWQAYKNQRTGQDERQFHFQTFVRVVPHSRGGVIRYLSSAPGIGQRTAERLWEKFGGDSVRVLRETPAVAVAGVDLSHFTIARAEVAAEFLRDEQSMEGCTIDLLDVLAGRGFPKSVAKKSVKLWGNWAAELIRRNPYRLMAFRGVGFLKTDAMYLDLGLPPAKLKRQAYCAWHAVASDSEGHTWYPVSTIERGIRAKVSAAVACPPAALKLAKRGKLLATRRDERGRLWVADYRKAAAESAAAERVAAHLSLTRRDWPDVADVSGLSDHQADRLRAALSRRIAILAGSPGTGKTYTAAALIREIVARFGVDQIAVAAPTGKAAVRISEALAGYGLSIRATTIHSLLGVIGSDPAAKEGDSAAWGFRHGTNDPLPQRFLVIDEGSMIDTSLFASFMAAVAIGTHVLIVGDTNQLPPVGHGAPLRDLIRADVPCGELTEIRRNSGTIVRACASIRDGRSFETAPRIDTDAEDPANLYVVRAGNPEEQIERMLGGIRAAAATGLDPVWDVQVLAPVNADSPLARKALNDRLQVELNATGATEGGNPFRVRDKIVCLKNGWLMLDPEFFDDVQECPVVGEVDDMIVYELRNGDLLQVTLEGKVYVANGELAAVQTVAANLTTAMLSSPQRVVCIPRGGKKSNDAAEGEGDQAGGGEGEGSGKSATGCQWELGYALTVHKSQGSEWPVVIVMIDEYPGARRVCSREWAYTAISRAKKLCLLVGKKHTADGMCRREALSRRKTFLAERIGEELKLYQAADAVCV